MTSAHPERPAAADSAFGDHRWIAFIRHAPTTWNVERRIQGLTDTPLAATARTEAARWRLPARYSPRTWFASPLRRTMETARLMGAAEILPAPLLVEMDWGEWSGITVTALRRDHGAAVGARERHGLDFRAPGGESPREVRERLTAWLGELSDERLPAAVLTHKGVIRAALSLATGWDMSADYPTRLERDRAQVFAIDRRRRLRIVELNVALTVDG